MARAVTVRVPVTSANMGAAFDSAGIALDVTADVHLTLHDAPAPPPTKPAEQLALAAAKTVFVRAGSPLSLNLQVEYSGDIPVGRGLGASAVLRAGAALAANRLLDDRFSADQVLEIATELEGHADNVAPAIFGGFQIVVWHEGKLSRIAVPLPANLHAVILVPDFDMPTSESRLLLPHELTRQEAVFNIGRAALLVAALATGRLDALRVATQDMLHQPVRATLFPALFDVIGAALSTGAACAYLSGGGSAVLALTTAGEDGREQIGSAMLAASERHGTSGTYMVTRPRVCGAEIISDESSG